MPSNQRLPLYWTAKSMMRRRAAVRGGDRAGAKVVGRFGAAERQFHVRVRIDAAGNDELAGSVDHVVGFHFELRADDGNRSSSIRMSAV